jgi:hypothetical protein
MDTADSLMKEYGYLSFKPIKDEWSEYLVEDGTLVRIKTVPLKFIQESDGKNYAMNADHIFATYSPKDLRKSPSNEPITESIVQKSIEKPDMEIKAREEPWNEYELNNGIKVFLKTVVTSVSSTKLHDVYGEPVYVIQHQVLIKKYPI